MFLRQSLQVEGKERVSQGELRGLLVEGHCAQSGTGGVAHEGLRTGPDTPEFAAEHLLRHSRKVPEITGTNLFKITPTLSVRSFN